MAIHTDAEKETKRGSFGYSDTFLYKFMFKYLWTFKVALMKTLGLMLIFSITTVVTPLILLNTINFLENQSNFTVLGIPWIDTSIFSLVRVLEISVFPHTSSFLIKISVLSLTYLFFIIFAFLVTYKRNLIVGTIGLLATKKIREDLFQHLQWLDMSYHDRNEVGRIMSRVTSDVEAIRQFYSGAIIENIMNLVTILAVSFVIWFINPVMAIITYLLIPVIIFLSMLQKKYGRPLHKESRRTNSILMAYLGESIQGIKVTKGMNREQKSKEHFAKLNREKTMADLKSRGVSVLFFTNMLFIQSLSIALIILAGGWLFIQGSIASVGLILVFLNYNIILFRPILILGNFYEQLQNALTGSERIYALLSMNTKVPVQENYPDMPEIKGKVEFQEVYFEYILNTPIYEHFNLTVPAGSTVALVGHTGAGKSTVVNMLSRLYEFQSGRILIDGIDVTQVSTLSFKRQIATVPQDFFLFSSSIRNNLKLGKPDASDEEIWNVLDMVNMKKYIEKLPLQLDTPVHERGARLSIGQRQLIIFSAVLLADPKIVILDEATSSVDIFSEILIQKALGLILNNRTSFIIAHRLSTIRNADLIVVIDQGKIIEQGTHETLLSNKSFYYQLIKDQLELSDIS